MSFQKKQYSKDFKSNQKQRSYHRDNSYGDDERVEKTYSEMTEPLSEKELFTKNETGIDFDKYEDIPVSCTGKITPINTFGADIHPTILANIKRANYVTPTPVQKYSIPIGIAGKDLMACAQTGSGKTAAFLIPVITRILKEKSTPTSVTSPRFLILAPTRELAIQIHKEALKFAFKTGLRPMVVYGGAPIKSQLKDVKCGVDILVATPGRLIDMIDRKAISLEKVKYLCFDEADRMLDMGFEKDIRLIVEQRDMPGVTDRVTTMFSATFPDQIRQLAADFLNNYLFLTVGVVGSTVDSITQVVKSVHHTRKRDELIKELRATSGRTLIFAETKYRTESVARQLNTEGFKVTTIHGNRTQAEREAALASFKSGRINVLVATDVASRGLDISDVVHVINYDLPNAIDSYIHRIGRTGRAGHKGLATSFFDQETNSGIVKELISVLEQSNQNVPLWLKQDFSHKRQIRPARKYATRSEPYNTRSEPHNTRSEPYNSSQKNNQYNQHKSFTFNPLTNNWEVKKD